MYGIVRMGWRHGIHKYWVGITLFMICLRIVLFNFSCAKRCIALQEKRSEVFGIKY